MERELLFADKLQGLRDLAKAQANIVTKDQVEEAFEVFGLDEEQFALVYDYLNKHKIGIGEAVDTEEYMTDEENTFLQMYIDEIALIPLVSSGEREAIVLSAMAGDGSAQEALINQMLSQVVDIAKLYVGQGVFLEDLIGEGNVALAMGVKMLGAMENAAEAEGMLTKMVMDAMEDYISENAEESKKDKRISDKVNKVADAARELSESYGRKVTADELSEESGMSVKAILEAMKLSGGKIEDLEN